MARIRVTLFLTPEFCENRITNWCLRLIDEGHVLDLICPPKGVQIVKRLPRLMLLSIVSMMANPPVAITQVQEWVARFNGPGNGRDEAYGIGTDGDGNVYVTGFATLAPPAIYTDFTTMRYSPSGNIDWIAYYDGLSHSTDEARLIHVDGVGNTHVCGTSFGGLPGSAKDYATIRYNAAGVTQWSSRYNTPAYRDDYALAMAVDRDDNVFVTGVHNTGLADFDADWTTVKYSASGVQQWAVHYGGPAQFFDVPRGIAVDNMGGVFVTGEVCFASQNWNFVTIKYDRVGIQEWLRVFDSEGSGYDAAHDICLDNDGALYVTGYSSFNGLGRSYATTIKYDSSGTQLWVAHYGDESNAQAAAFHMQLIPLDGICIAGRTGAFGEYKKWDFLTIRYGPDGTEHWAQRYDGPASSRDIVNALSIDAASNVYTVGSSYTTASDYSSDYVVIKYNRDGAQQWIVNYDGPGNSLDEPTDSVVDNAGNVCVTGYSYSGADQSSSDYATLKYSQPGWPSIIQQPSSSGVCVGGTATFNTIAASPTGITYQWRSNGVALGENERIAGTDTSTLSIYPVLVSDAGSYDVIVGNEIGAAVSRAVTLAPAGGGDGNFDGKTNGLDIQAFVQVLASGPTTEANACPFDMNADGIVDTFDVQPFATMLMGL
ncbi:MAG: SBBP repeat-containing protein [Planctomycetota bacterium]